VIVSASRGQYLKPDSQESGFFSNYIRALYIRITDGMGAALIVR
jgi:hypothetical protein